MRGCGLGILFASIALMIAFHTQKSTLDDDAVMERASELGMIMPETQNADTEADTQSSVVPATEDLNVKNPNTSDKKADLDQKTDGTENADIKKSETSKKSDDSTEKDDSANESEEITVTIKKGEVCRQLAENLAELGLVEDAESFRKYMQQCGYDDQIRVGTYQLKRGMTQKEIAKVFVTK